MPNTSDALTGLQDLPFRRQQRLEHPDTHPQDRVATRDSKYLRAPANDPAAQPIITLTRGAWIPFLHNILDESGHDTDDENHTTYPSIEPQPGGDGRRTNPSTARPPAPPAMMLRAAALAAGGFSRASAMPPHRNRVGTRPSSPQPEPQD